jgi:hypothetical protein
MKVYGVILAYRFTNAALLFFDVETRFRVNIADKRVCLRKVYVDGFTRRYILIKGVRSTDRAVIRTGSTAGTFFLYDVSRRFNQGYREIPCFSFYTLDFG